MKCVSIETINKLQPIEGSDNIENATIHLWTSVVQKGDFNIGDKCIFIPIDTDIDTTRRHFNDFNDFTMSRPPYMRVNTCSIRGTISQGIALPLSRVTYLNNISQYLENDELIIDGVNLATYLGITKYKKDIMVDINNDDNTTIPPFPH